MRKFLYLSFLLILLACNSVIAQSDTVMAYMKNYHEVPGLPASAYIIDVKDSADFARIITKPDKSIDKKLFQVRDFYFNGRQKLLGYSNTGNLDAEFQGVCMEYFPNGKRKALYNYEQGTPTGEVARYFPNGGLYITGSYNANQELTVSVCKDSTGKILAENGTGAFMIYDDDFKTVIAEGAIKNGLKDGKWQGVLNDTLKYEANYTGGKFTSGFSLGKSGLKTELATEYTAPTLIFKAPNGRTLSFGDYIGRNVRYPALALEQRRFGKVNVEMFVTSNGQLIDIRAVKGDKILADELLRVMMQSPLWQPGKYLGQPVDTKYSFWVNFTMSGNMVSVELLP